MREWILPDKTAVFSLLVEDMPFEEAGRAKEFLPVELEKRLILAAAVHGGTFWEFSRNRITAVINNIGNKTSDTVAHIWGPPKNIAFSANGEPTKALEGFLKKNGCSSDQITLKARDGTAYVYLEKTEKGRDIKEVLPPIFTELLSRIPFEKKMQIGEGPEFIRPLRKIHFFINGETVPFEYKGIKNSRITLTAFFSEPLEIKNGEQFLSELEKAGSLGEAARAKILENAISGLSQRGFSTDLNDHQKKYLAYLTENPAVIEGEFGERFLRLPTEIIESTLWKHQKCVLLRRSGNPVNRFITVMDRSCDMETVVKGYEGVVLSRLEDAEFFWDLDLGTDLDEFKDVLKDIVLFEGWGSYKRHCEYLERTAALLARLLGLKNIREIENAAKFAKADLASNVVNEKTYADLQGIMGYYYAKNKGLSEITATAIKEHYLPGREENCPDSEEGAVLSIADKMVLLSALFSAGLPVSGSEDIYGARRAALGIYKIIIKFGFSFDILKLLREFDYLDERKGEELFKFIIDRIRSYEKEIGRIGADIIEAAARYPGGDLLALRRKIRALGSFSEKEDFPKTKITLKRVMNILEGATDFGFDPELISEKEEKDLFKAFEEFKKCLSKRENYEDMFADILLLKPYIDAFFDNVKVNVDDEKIRNNRKGLLVMTAKELLKIADFKIIN